MTFPVFLIMATVQWIGCFFTCVPDAWANVKEVTIAFIQNTYEIPRSWGYQIWAISFNVLYWLYLVYLYVALVAWAFLERYLSWFFNIIGITMGWAWSFTEWLVETSARTLYYIYKYTIVFGLQGTVELFWDTLVWLR